MLKYFFTVIIFKTMLSITFKPKYLAFQLLIVMFFMSCSGQKYPMPSEIIDLSPTITEDMPERLMGTAFFNMLGMEPTVEFKHYIGEPPLYYLDSYITLFNHAGPHVDAPRHMIPNTAAVNEYDLDRFYGKAILLDFSDKPGDYYVTLDEIKGFNIKAGDFVILYCDYKVSENPEELPTFAVPSKEAADYLAELPIKCYATDGMSVDNLRRLTELLGEGELELEILAPVHHAFLSRGIPVIEGLQNLQAITSYKEIVFAGFPLKTTGKAGDAAPMRAVALIY